MSIVTAAGFLASQLYLLLAAHPEGIVVETACRKMIVFRSLRGYRGRERRLYAETGQVFLHHCASVSTPLLPLVMIMIMIMIMMMMMMTSVATRARRGLTKHAISLMMAR